MYTNVYTSKKNKNELVIKFERNQKELKSRIHKYHQSKQQIQQHKALLLQRSKLIKSLGTDITKKKKNELIQDFKLEKGKFDSNTKKLIHEHGVLQTMIKNQQQRKKEIMEITVIQDIESKTNVDKRKRHYDDNESNLPIMPKQKRQKTSSSFNNPRYVTSSTAYQKFKEDKKIDTTYLELLRKGERIDPLTTKWYYLRTLVDSRNSLLIMNDEKMLLSLLTTRISYVIKRELESFSDSELLPLLLVKDINAVWKKRESSNIQTINEISKLDFHDLRRDIDFNMYLLSIDELKINTNVQLSYFNISKLHKSTITRNDKYSTFLGYDKSVELNTVFRKLRESHSIISEAIKITLFINHTISKNNNHKIIMEIIYYYAGEKISIYYIMSFNTTD